MGGFMIYDLRFMIGDLRTGGRTAVMIFDSGFGILDLFGRGRVRDAVEQGWIGQNPGVTARRERRAMVGQGVTRCREIWEPEAVERGRWIF
jgi:hypothetical protein